MIVPFTLMTLLAMILVSLLLIVQQRDRRADSHRGMVPWCLPDGKYRFIGAIEYRGVSTALMFSRDGRRWSTDWTGKANFGDIIEYSSGSTRVISRPVLHHPSR